MIGDAPQALIANVTRSEAAEYLTNRSRYGINTLWINLLCNDPEGCNKDAMTFDGLAPFTNVGDLSTPNPAYFQRADEIIRPGGSARYACSTGSIETIGAARRTASKRHR